MHNKLFVFFGYDTIRNNGTAYGNGWYDTASLDGESASGTIANKFLSSRAPGASTAKFWRAPRTALIAPDRPGPGSELQLDSGHRALTLASR